MRCYAIQPLENEQWGWRLLTRCHTIVAPTQNASNTLNMTWRILHWNIWQTYDQVSNITHWETCLNFRQFKPPFKSISVGSNSSKNTIMRDWSSTVVFGGTPMFRDIALPGPISHVHSWQERQWEPPPPRVWLSYHQAETVGQAPRIQLTPSM